MIHIADDSGTQGTLPNISPCQDRISIVLTAPVEVPSRKRDRGVQTEPEEDETVKTKQKTSASNFTLEDRMPININSVQVENGQEFSMEGNRQLAPVKEPETHSQPDSSQFHQDQVTVER